MNKDNLFCYYEGSACQTCGAPLRVTEAKPTNIPAHGGLTIATCLYECTGPVVHRWGDGMDFDTARGGEHASASTGQASATLPR